MYALEQQLTATTNATARETLTRHLQWARDRLAAKEAGAAALLDLDRYNKVAANRALTDRSRKVLVGLGVLALVCGIGFQLALSAPAEKKDDDSPDASAVAAGSIATMTLTGKPGSEAAARWDALGLKQCKPARKTARSPHERVFVYVVGGKGVADDPYEVETIPESTAANSSCERIRFKAAPEMALVSVPVATVIKIKVKSSPSASPSSE